MQIDFQETEGVEKAGAALPWIVCGWLAFFHFGNPVLFSCFSFDFFQFSGKFIGMKKSEVPGGPFNRKQRNRE